jgi:predicted RNA-binding Zn ribbon-like protein
LRFLKTNARVTRASPAHLGEMPFELTGGSVCLDFANTASARSTGQLREHLHHYGDLIAWARQRGILSDSQAADLRAEAARRPPIAAAVFAQAVSFREAVYTVTSAIAHSEPAPPAALDRLSGEIARAAGQARLISQPNGFAWDWASGSDPFELVVDVVAQSALELMTSADVHRIRQCAGQAEWGCDWLFLDRSSMGNRTWCDKQACANRAKARRHRARVRGQRDQSLPGAWEHA